MALGTAIRHLKKGQWEKAHAIVQQDESRFGCWAHGIVHIVEGDFGNARYWYRRAGRPFPKERYLEYDWIAEEGSFVYEPPGEVHTLVVPEDCREMITFSNISGAMIYLDQAGQQIGYEDVFTKIEMCRRHYRDAGLGADYVDQFIR